MSTTGKQSPLGVNVLTSLLQNIGLHINPIMTTFVGTSTSVSSAPQLGQIVNGTCLRLLTYAINDAYTRGQPSLVTAGSFVIGSQYTIISVGTTSFTSIGASSNTVGITFTATEAGSGTGTAMPGTATSYTVSDTTYKNLITIGSTSIPALGNSPPAAFNWSGYPAWAPQWGTSPSTREVTQWGYVRLFALQGYNEFNYNSGLPAYKDFLSGFTSDSSFVDYTNQAILAVHNSQDFLDGTYSNMNDLITGDITGVSLSTQVFGQDLIALGKAIDLSQLDTFGLPSNLLKLLAKNNAFTKNLSLAIVSSGILPNELDDILNNVTQPTIEQERNIYACFYLTVGDALTEVLTPLNCKTQGLESVADLLNPVKLFPNSYKTLTVPVYNTQPNLATNSKTYYLIYGSNGNAVNVSINPSLSSSQVVNQIGTQIPAGTPAVAQKQVTVYQYTMTDEQGNPIDLVAKLVDAAAGGVNVMSAGDGGGDGGSAGGDGGGGSGGGGGGAM